MTQAHSVPKSIVYLCLKLNLLSKQQVMVKLQDILGFNEKEMKSTEERQGDVTRILVLVAVTKLFRQQTCTESISLNISLPSESLDYR